MAKLFRPLGMAALVLFAAPAALHAQSSQSQPFKVTANHAEAIKLPAPGTVALVANPDIADIINERNALIFVLGRKPGTTNLLVYDKDGKPLFDREIVVVPEEERMVTITRDTDVTDYFCEPRCRFYEHEQGGAPPAAPQTAGGAAPAATAGPGAAAGPNAAAPLGAAAGGAVQGTGQGAQSVARPGYP